MNQLPNRGAGQSSAFADLKSWLRRNFGPPSTRDQPLTKTYLDLDALNQAVDVAGSAGLTGEQRVRLYEILLAASACDIPALARLLVIVSRQDQALLDEFRRLDDASRAGLRSAARAMSVESVNAERGAPSARSVGPVVPAPGNGGPPGPRHIRAKVIEQLADQIYVFEAGRDDRRR